MKTFGVVLAPGKGDTFVRQVETDMPVVHTVIKSLLSAWKTTTMKLKKLDDEIKNIVRDSDLHRNLMTVPALES